MELIVTIFVAFPLGYIVRHRMAAYVAFIAIHSFVFSFQSAQLVREWSAGSTEVFPTSGKSVPWSYGVVNALIYADGFGLVTLGTACALDVMLVEAPFSLRPDPARNSGRRSCSLTKSAEVR